MQTEEKSTINPQYSRFKDAPWFSSYPVTIVGQGGIGSWLSLLLARGGHQLYLYDDDTVEEHNLGGQLFHTSSISSLKVKAVQQVIRDLSGATARGVFGKFTEGCMTARITFSGPDNMAARRLVAKEWSDWLNDPESSKLSDMGPSILIDGRMENEMFQVFAINSRERWDKYMKEDMFDDNEVATAPCTFKATSHNAAIIAGVMTGVLNNEITNFKAGKIIREVPYKIEFELPTMTFNAV